MYTGEVDVNELFVAASATASAPVTAGKKALADADLSELFGVEIDTGSTPDKRKIASKSPIKKPTSTAKSAAKKSKTAGAR